MRKQGSQFASIEMSIQSIVCIASVQNGAATSFGLFGLRFCFCVNHHQKFFLTYRQLALIR